MAIISAFQASRPKDHKHWGVDLSAPIGTPIYANMAMTVLRYFANWSYGPVLELQDTYNTKYILAHLDWSPLTPGKAIKVGDLVGYSGEGGNAANTIPHTHYEVRILGTGPQGQVDPTGTDSNTSKPYTSAFGYIRAGNTLLSTSATAIGETLSAYRVY
jgi:murein DD-endopeptidase MepM/ murein hydrolase activator NlpD